MGDDIKSVVQALNRPPFNMRLSLVALDNKKGLDLMQIVNDVFAYLNPKQKRDVHEEPPAVMAARMLEFVVVLNYKTGADLDAFSEAFIRADPPVVHEFLAWMLHRLPELRKRAYLARFLRPVVIPDEYFADDQIVSLMQKYQAAQDEFKEQHKSIERLRQTHRPPGALEKDIKQLEVEMEQLDNKLIKLRHRVDSAPEFQHVDFDDVLQATHALRKEQEEEAQLQQSVREQQYRLEKAQAARRQAAAELKELQDTETSRTDPQILMQRLRDQVAKNRVLCNERLERELRDKDRLYRELEKALTSAPLSLEMVDQLHNECEALQGEVHVLSSQRDAAMSRESDSHVYRTSAAAAESKRAKLQDRYDHLESEREDLQKDLQKLDQELKALTADGKKPMSDKDLAAYSEKLKDQVAHFKDLKMQLKAAQQEVVILQQTEQVLRARDDKLEEITEELERARGLEGYTATQSSIEGLAVTQADLNSTKGNTLDEISKMVDKITTVIQSKRSKLQPCIRELKQVRQDYDEVEAEYVRRTRQHDNVAGGLRIERDQLKEEIQKYQTEISNDESFLHSINANVQIQSARAEQLRQEELFNLGKGRLSRDCRTYQERLERAIDADMKDQKRLLDEQRAMKASHQDDVGQRKAFIGLRALLQAKLASTKKEQARSQARDSAASVTMSVTGAR